MEFSFVSPENLRMPKDVIDVVAASGRTFTEIEDVHPVVAGADVLYVTRVQKERFGVWRSMSG